MLSAMAKHDARPHPAAVVHEPSFLALPAPILGALLEDDRIDAVEEQVRGPARTRCGWG